MLSISPMIEKVHYSLKTSFISWNILRFMLSQVEIYLFIQKCDITDTF